MAHSISHLFLITSFLLKLCACSGAANQAPTTSSESSTPTAEPQLPAQECMNPIRCCKDIAILDQWFVRAISALSATDIFQE